LEEKLKGNIENFDGLFSSLKFSKKKKFQRSLSPLEFFGSEDLERK